MSLLQFEWAWQHPAKSRRLGSGIGPGKRSRETGLEHRFRILSEMLSVCPWRRLPLTVRWLVQEYYRDFPSERQPPAHMPIAYGPVEWTSSCSGKKKTGAREKERREEEEGKEEEEGEGKWKGEAEEGEKSSSSDVSCFICHQVHI